MLKLKELRDISGHIAKKEYVSKNKDDKEFIMCLRFLLDDMIITNISTKKLSKEIKLTPSTNIKDLTEFIDYLIYSSGKDIHIINIRAFIDKHNEAEKEILEGLACKNYKVDFGIKFFNEVMGKDGIAKSPYMGCKQFDEKKVKKLFEANKSLISQVKNDGQFLNCIVKGDDCFFTARSGLPQYINGQLVDELLSIKKNLDYDFVITGELMIDGYDRKTANGIIRSLIASNKKILDGDLKEEGKFFKKYGVSIKDIENKLRLIVWDLIPFNSFLNKRYEVGYLSRLKVLEENLKSDVIKITGYKIVYSYKEAIQHFRELLNNGEEGSVLKTLNGIWKDGKPDYQIKMKLEIELDLKVKGFNSGKPKTKYENTLGSLYVESEDGLLSTNISGIPDKDRDYIWKNKDSFIDKVVVIKCNGTSKNKEGENSLLYANFMYVREDKMEANTFEEIVKIENMKLQLTK